MLALLALAFTDHIALFFLSFVLFGIAGGINQIIGGPLFASLYGTKHLGAIKSIKTSVLVFSTAVAPVMYGFFIDAGVSMETILLGSALYCCVMCLIMLIFVRPTLPKKTG